MGIGEYAVDRAVLGYLTEVEDHDAIRDCGHYPRSWVMNSIDIPRWRCSSRKRSRITA